jgi:hypothetical protein
MSVADYVIDILLIAIVILQMRPRPLTPRAMLRPLILVAVAGAHYLRAVHLGGNDVALIFELAVIGVLLGAGSARATRVWSGAGGVVLAQAGLFAAALWVAGMGFRFAFALYANSTGGREHVARFSEHHDITSGQVWTTALVLMAFGEVLARVGYLQWRGSRVLPDVEH